MFLCPGSVGGTRRRPDICDFGHFMLIVDLFFVKPFFDILDSLRIEEDDTKQNKTLKKKKNLGTRTEN